MKPSAVPATSQRLPYLKSLGVDYIWVTPFYPSPMKDNGYDVADYCAVNPMFGTMEDAEAMIAEADALEALRTLSGNPAFE